MSSTNNQITKSYWWIWIGNPSRVFVFKDSAEIEGISSQFTHLQNQWQRVLPPTLNRSSRSSRRLERGMGGDVGVSA